VRNAIFTGLLPGLLALGIAAPTARAAGKKPDYDAAFPRDRLLRVKVELSREGWRSLPVRPFAYTACRAVIDKKEYSRVGLRFKGNSSASVRTDRKSFKIDFDRFEKGGNFHGVRKLNFHNGFKDPTMMRESLAYALFRSAGLPASRTAFARVFVTVPGLFQDRYLGLYSVVEQVDSDFLRDRFDDPGGTLWKGEGLSDLTYLGEDPDLYENYHMKTNRRRGDYSPLIALTRFLSKASEGELKKELPSLFEVEKFLAFLAANTLLSNLDSYLGTGHNYYLYHQPSTGKFTFIPWDLNEAYGNFKMGSTADMENLSLSEPFSSDKILARRVLSVPTWMKKYKALLREMTVKFFSVRSQDLETGRLRKLIAESVEQDREKEYSTEDFFANIEREVRLRGPHGFGGTPGLKSFVRNRLKSVRAQLAGRERGVKPRGREIFRRPPGGAGKFLSALAASEAGLYRLSEDGTLWLLDPDTLRPRKSVKLPAAIEGGSSGKPEEGKQRILKELDRDGDGRISRNEWRGSQKIFRAVDRNRDGFLDGKELDSFPGPGPAEGPGFPPDRRGGRQEAPREVILGTSDSFVFVVKGGTLFLYRPGDLSLVGHNRFAEAQKRGFGRPKPPSQEPVPCAETSGDTLFLFDGSRALKFDLATLRVKADFDWPKDGEERRGNALEKLDRNGDGGVDRFEFQGPPELFRRLDRNRDGRLDKKELRDLPPDFQGAGPGDGGPKLSLVLTQTHLFLSRGDEVRKLDRKSLKVVAESGKGK
jgi:hypothetical protein